MKTVLPKFVLIDLVRRVSFKVVELIITMIYGQ